jgi:hypothetical protein
MKKIITLLLTVLLVFSLVGCREDTKIYADKEVVCESKIVQIGYTMFDVCDFTAMMGNITEDDKTVIRLWLDNGEVLNLTYHDKDSMLVDYNKLLSEVFEEPQIEYVEVIVEVPGDTIYVETLVGYTEEEVIYIMDDILEWVFNAIDILEDTDGYTYTYDHDSHTIHYTSSNIYDSSGVVTLAYILEDNY